jgi:flagellar basal body rod protein FlgC
MMANRNTNGLYLMEQPGTLNAAHTTTKSSKLSILAHRRMGHINYNSLKLLSHMSGFVLDYITKHLCECCILSKQHRGSFSPSDSNAKKTLDLVHTDLSLYPVPTIVGDFLHYCSFTDDHSRFITVYLIKLKSDATAAFIHYDKRVFNLFGSHVSTLGSDGGGEFFNEEMTAYCADNGIFQQSSTSYTLQHNYRAERPNRTLNEGALAMRLDAGLPKSYWGFAIQTFVWLKNRSPHAAIYKKTPFEARFDPSHPAANEEGYVLLPNVSRSIESLDMKEAQRSYEANLGAIETTKRMYIQTIDLLR